MARKGEACSSDIVSVARAQAETILKEAEQELKKHKKGKFPECDKRLATAKTFMNEARKSTKGTNLDERNAYIRATFHAGQAKLCPFVAALESGQVEVRAGKRKRAKKAKKTT